MGSKPLPAPGPFSRAITDYVNGLVLDRGGDKSGRWLSKQPEMTQTQNYYRLRQIGQSLYTTNDIADFARLFRLSPQQFVQNAVDHAMEQLGVIQLSERRDRTYDELKLPADRGIVDAEEGGDPTP